LVHPAPLGQQQRATTMTDRFHTLALGRNRVVLDTEVGHLRTLELEHRGRTVAPLHVAPWVNDAPIDRDAALSPIEQALASDFLCAPFCASDVEPGPSHGWTASAPWHLTGQSNEVEAAEATYRLSRPVMGAEVTKSLRLRAGEPFLYVEHQFTGGTGHVPVSHHAMIRVTDKAAISYSPKAMVFTGDQPPESDPARGRSLLKYPSQGEDLGAVPLAAGGVVDVGTYPVADRHEDVVDLVEAPGNTLGWTAVVREAEDDIVLLLKNSRVLPQTTLWMSNGGRDYAPWNGRHTRVLGLEDGRSFGTAGHRASIEPNVLTARGIPTAFDLETEPSIRYAIGAVPRPEGWTRIESVGVDGEAVVLAETGGNSITLPFAAGWLLT
jgi:hypothetical protein